MSLSRLKQLLAFAGLFLSTFAHAADNPNGTINYSWIDDSGAISQKKWPAKGKWVNKHLMSDEDFERPAFEVAVEIPDNVVVNDTVLKADQGFLNSSASSKHTIVFDTFSPLTILHLNISENNEPAKDLNLLVMISNSRLLTIKDRDCADEGIEMTTANITDSIPYLYIGLKCDVDQNNKLITTLYWSSDLKFVKAFYEKAYGGGKFAKNIKSGKYYSTFQFASIKSDPLHPIDYNAPMVLGHFILNSTTNTQVTSNQDITLTWKPSSLKPKDDSFEMGRKLLVVPSLGFSSVNYSQAGISNYSEIGLTAKASVTQFVKPPHWDVDAITFLTLATITTNTSGVSARFLGINGRIGYHFDPIGPWSFSVYTGIYYTTMFVTNSDFGFTNMMGPLLFPSFKRSIGKDALTGYIKYSPVAQGLGVDFGNKEIALGLGFLHPLPNGHTLSTNLDFADDQLLVEGIKIGATSFSISAGYSF